MVSGILSLRGLLILLGLGVFTCSMPSAVFGASGLQLTWGGGRALEQVVNFRGGVSTANEGSRPTMCLEVIPWGPLSMEACGTGAGILHSEPGAEMAHFRAKWTAVHWKLQSSNLKIQPALGFAELQLTADNPGFNFGRPDEGAIELAGPEASMSFQWQTPLFAGMELVGDLNMGLGWFQFAPKLAEPQSQLQPFIDLTVGLGW